MQTLRPHSRGAEWRTLRVRPSNLFFFFVCFLKIFIYLFVLLCSCCIFINLSGDSNTCVSLKIFGLYRESLLPLFCPRAFRLHLCFLSPLLCQWGLFPRQISVLVSLDFGDAELTGGGRSDHNLEGNFPGDWSVLADEDYYVGNGHVPVESEVCSGFESQLCHLYDTWFWPTYLALLGLTSSSVKWR